MRVSLNLSQQGLILVGVPIGLMLAFLVTLFFLLLRVEKEAAEADHSRTVISTANSLVKQYYDAGSQLIIYKHAKTEKARQKFLVTLQGTEDSFNELKSLLKGDVQELRMLDKLKSVAEEGMALMRKYERFIGGQEKLTGLEVIVLYKEFDMSGARFTEKLEELSALETARHKVNSKEERTLRVLVKFLILVGVIVAIGVGTALSLAFTRSTSKRLALLMDNTTRLSKKEALLPMLEGTDEISRLDLFFHKMADELAAATRKERAILDNAVDVICSIDGEGIFTAVNPASLQVLGYEPERLIGMHFKQLIAKDDVQKFADALAERKLSAGHKGDSQAPAVVNVENRVASADGTIIHILWSLRWSESEQSLFCVAHDISDRKNIERLKQEFISIISHELSTPLTSLQMTLTLLLNGNFGPISDAAEQRVRTADTGISRLMKLIADLLDIEKMEAGKLSMRFFDVDVAELIEKAVDDIQGFAEKNKVEIEVAMEKARILADSDRIVQVIVNLLSNAIKFSEEGDKVQITTSRVKDDEDVSFVELRVIDHGAGVPEGSESAIFARYEQAHTTTKKRTRGTGLGLPICKAIVEQHGGSIGVLSTAGGGSTFWFRIPN